MTTLQTATRTFTHLSLAERRTIDWGLQRGLSLRFIARMCGRSVATISREIARNGGGAGYSCHHAQQRRDLRFKRVRPHKLVPGNALFGRVCELLRKRWSPQQIATHLKALRPLAAERHLRVSHETVYTCIYSQPRGELKRELVGLLRLANSARWPRSKGKDRRGQIKDALSIHLRPPEAHDRQLPGHWESDLIMGKLNQSAIGTIVERTTRLVILVKLPHPHPKQAEHVLNAFSDKLNQIAQPMRKTLTHDRGSEMALHQQLTERTGMKVYFCDPHSPWQRGSNENTNGLLRQYFPNGTDLSGYSQEELDAVADQLNGRPRKTLGWKNPLQVYGEWLHKLSIQPDSLQ